MIPLFYRLFRLLGLFGLFRLFRLVLRKLIEFTSDFKSIFVPPNLQSFAGRKMLPRDVTDVIPFSVYKIIILTGH